MPLLLNDNRDTELFSHFSIPKENSEEYTRLNSFDGSDLAKELGIEIPDGYELRIVMTPQAGTDLEIFMLNHNTKRIAYFNRVEQTDLHFEQLQEDRPVRQVMIWRASRGSDVEATRDIVATVFFQKLKHAYTPVLSDTEQTRDGKRMWERLLDKAMCDETLIAATADLESQSVEIIEDEDELAEKVTWLWGTESCHKERLGVIASL